MITADNGFKIQIFNPIKKVRMSCDAGIIFHCSKCELKVRGLLTILNFTLARQQGDNILNRLSNSALFNIFFMHKQSKFRVNFMHTVITKTNKPMFSLWARRQPILIEKAVKTDIFSEREDYLLGRRWDMREKTNCF